MSENRLIYAGIGSRSTPSGVLQLIFQIGFELAQRGWILRSGHASGADTVFENGAREGRGKMEIFIPWEGFNGATNGYPYILPPLTQAVFDLAAQHHPAWDRCSPGAQRLHARNGFQVLGANLDEPVSMIVCWTEGARGEGGTGQALRIARSRRIPVFDLGDPRAEDALRSFVLNHEPQQS